MDIVTTKDIINKALFDLYDKINEDKKKSIEDYNIINSKLNNHFNENKELISENKRLEKLLSIEKNKHSDYENIINELNKKLNEKVTNEEHLTTPKLFNILKLLGLSENKEDNSKIEKEVQKEIIQLCSSFPIYGQ